MVWKQYCGNWRLQSLRIRAVSLFTDDHYTVAGLNTAIAVWDDDLALPNEHGHQNIFLQLIHVTQVVICLLSGSLKDKF